MGLAATLTTRLDCRAVGAQLIDGLQGPGADLGALTLPVSPEQFEGAVGAAGEADASPIGQAVAQLAGRIPAALGALPQADQIVRPLAGALSLAGQLAANDLPTLFDAVLDRLRTELRDPPDGGHVALLLRVTEVLQAAPEGQALRQLVAALLPAADLSRGSAFPFLDILRGLDGAVRILGALMALETVLAEGERLAGLLCVRLDPAAIDGGVAALQAALGDGAASLASRVVAVDVGNRAALAGIVAEVGAGAAALTALGERYALGLGMDEATLAYLDLDRLQAEIDAARAQIRAADAAPARRAIEALAALIDPLLAPLDFGTGPAGGIAALLASAEAQVAGLASAIDSLDTAVITSPLADGLRTLTAPLRELQQLIDTVMLALRGALDGVRNAVAELPLDDLANTLRDFLAPVAGALDAVRALLDQVEAALQAAADVTSAALTQVDGALDAFQTQIDAFFGEARAAVEEVDLDQAVAAVAQQVQAFADALAQAQLKPVFDAATSAIDAAVEVVEAVPFDLLPDSMKADVDAAVQPIKAVDADAVEQQIESLLGIGPDGSFAPRADLEAAIEEVHQKFQALLAVVEQNHPRTLLADVDARLEALAQQVRTLEPDLTLQPVRDALDALKQALDGVDLDHLLAPLREAFAQIVGALDGLSVASLVAPVQQQIDEARSALIEAIRLDRWETSLDELRTQALALLEQANPQQMRVPIEAALADMQSALAGFPALRPGAALGTIVAAMLGATGRRVQPSSFPVVLDWLGGAAAGHALAARSDAIAASIGDARTLVQRVDPAIAGAALNSRFAALRDAVQGLVSRLDAASSERARLANALPRLDSAALLGNLAAQRARYLEAPGAAAGRAEAFRREGFSEADVGVAALRQAAAPLAPSTAKVRALFGAIGVSPAELSVAGVIDKLLSVAPPQRLVDIVLPVFEALHRRLAALLDGVIDPLRAAAADLRALLDAVDLAPLVEAADGIVQQAKAEIEALSPDHVLAEPLAAFAALRSAIVEQDPLAVVGTILANLRELIARVLEKLDLERLLASPLAIYDHILGEVSGLDPRGLLTPVFDQLDVIAQQVDSGLDATVSGFKRLQEALPEGGGGSSASVAIGTP